ncbi:MAG: YceI family protein [Verrucomicrobia bacterium]|jgi:polyisoprenoid-binding protein YceI|nr:YceI family protein [Verrucomicrobiota bacterium]MBT7734541.1 YceI family protein [Verrucomicrobiota bacterium]MBT7911964.1 YceI family protein [Verrucomicrobiota bacterium]
MKQFSKGKLVWLLILSVAPGVLSADSIKFDFRDPKKVNNVVFLMDAPLESINGTATGVSGTVSFDPANPAATTGKIVLATSSLHVDNPVMKKHMLDEGWMHVSKFPTIEFVAGKMTNVKTSGTNITGTIAGKLTVKGVTKKVSVPVRLTYLKGMLIKRNRVPGDLLVLRSDFTIKRSDYGINAGNNEEKVSDEIELKLRVAGAAPY